MRVGFYGAVEGVTGSKNHLHGSHKENSHFDAVGCCKGDV
jgi:hypothetical protein